MAIKQKVFNLSYISALAFALDLSSVLVLPKYIHKNMEKFTKVCLGLYYLKQNN